MAPSPRKKSTPTKIVISESTERSRRTSTKLVTAATNSAISQKPCKSPSPPPPPRPLRNRKSTPESSKTNPSDGRTKDKSSSNSADHKPKDDNKKSKAVNIPKKRKREDENQNNKKSKVTDSDDSVRRSRRETTRISTLATLNSPVLSQSEGEDKSRSASVEPPAPLRGKKKDVSPLRSKRRSTALSSLATKNAQSQDRSVEEPEQDSSDDEDIEQVDVSPPSKAPTKVSPRAPAKTPTKARAKAPAKAPPRASKAPRSDDSGSRRSVRSSTAISTLASNNAASQAPFVVEESDEESGEEELSSNESEEQYEDVPKRGRGRPGKAKAAALSPNNPFAAVTREYKEQQKIVAKLNRKRKSSLSPDERPRLLSEEENNRLFDSLFGGEEDDQPLPLSSDRNGREKSKKISKSSKGSKKQIRAAIKTTSQKRSEMSPESSTERKEKSVPIAEDSSSVLPSLTWAKTSTSSPSSSRIVAPWRKLGEVDKPNTEEQSDIYEFGGQTGESSLKVKGEHSPERRKVGTKRHGAYSGQLTAMTWKQKLEQSNQRSQETQRSPSRPMFGSPRRDVVSPEGRKLGSISPKGSPRHDPSFRNSSPRSESSSKIGSPRSETSHKTSSPRVDPSQRMGLPKVYGSALGRFGGRVGGSYKPSSGPQSSHQLSLTSLSSDYNIVAAVDKHHTSTTAVGLNLPEGSDQGQPLNQTDHNVKRKSFLLSRIFSKPPSKDQEDEAGSESGTATTSDIKYEEAGESKANTEMEEVKKEKRRNKDNQEEIPSKRPSRNSTRALNLKEVSSDSDSVHSNSSDLGGLKNNRKNKLQRGVKTEALGGASTNIVCTSCQRDDINLIKQLVKKFGTFTFSTTVGPNTSHVVTGEGKRTLNLLKGLLQGCWIVSKDWALASLEADHWVQEESYEMTNFSPAVRRIRLERKANKGEFKSELFKEVGSVFISNQCKAPRDELKQLIASGGGELSPRLDSTRICVGEEGGEHSVTEKWVLDSVQYHSVMPFSDYPV